MWNDWAALSGDSRWLYNNLLPIMQNVETYTPNDTFANPVQRGSSGPIFVTQLPPVDDDPYAQAVSSALNTPFVPDYNDPTYGNVGVVALQSNTTPGPDGVRSFSINGYLPESVVSKKGKGLHGRKLCILSKATVNRVIFSGKKAKGVEFIHTTSDLEIKKAYAKKKVILCAGTLNTPGILERSGIGDAALLESLGIDVLVNNPNVGNNMINHYGTGAFIAGPVMPPADPFAQFALTDANPYYPNDGVRRLVVLTIPLFPGFSNLGTAILNPKSLGSVHITSKDPLTVPELLGNVFSDGPVTTPGTDAYTAVSSLKLIKAIADEAGDVVVQPTQDEYDGGDEALLAYCQGNPNILNHWAGSTRMAKSAADGVVDGKLHVFGVKNLMVVDLGIAPRIPDGNTCMPVYVIAEEAARILGAS